MHMALASEDSQEIMSGTRLYVGNLSYGTNDEQLKNFFEAAGPVKSAEVVIDRASGRSKGFGFVEMTTEEGAQNAMNSLNGNDLDQRPIRIDFAKPKEDRPRTGGFGGGDRGSGGGFGGGGGGGFGGDRGGSSRGGNSRGSSGRGGSSGGRDRDRSRYDD